MLVSFLSTPNGIVAPGPIRPKSDLIHEIVDKIVRSVKDASNFRTSSESAVWAWRRILQDDALYAELNRGMSLIRSHAGLFDFLLQGYDL